jgi:arginyl-tRNA synthetase
MSLLTDLTASVWDAVQAILPAGQSPSVTAADIVVERAARPEFGDFTTNVAMRLARALRLSPGEIAAELRPRLAHVPGVAAVTLAGAGYLNLWIDWQHWMAGASGLPMFPARSGKVVVEHTSVNPNKAAHVGHLRNACIGDSVVRLLRRTGHQVEVHNYIDDLGRQVADTLVGLLYLPEEAVTGNHPRFSDYCWDVYAAVHHAYQAGGVLKGRTDGVLHALEAGENRIAWLAEAVVHEIVSEQLQDMARFGIAYDLLVHESDIVRAGLWQAAFERLQESSRFSLEEEGPLAGCWVLKQEDEGSALADDDHIRDKVLVRSNGVLTYTAKDIAYHLWKFGLVPVDFRYHPMAEGLCSTGREAAAEAPAFGHATAVVNVIDRRQDYPQAMVRSALAAVGFPEAAQALRHISYGVVSLSRRTAASLGVPVEDGRDTYPMAGRQGIGIKITDLLDVAEAHMEAERSRTEGLASRAIAAGAIRYYLLRHHLATEIVFDTSVASDVHGNTGPYLMYSHARASGVLRRAQALPEVVEMPTALDDTERMLLASLAEWPDRLEEAAAALNPTAVATYVYQLADQFNRFYEQCPVLKADEPERGFRLQLTRRVQETMADALGLLGVPAPAAM